VSKSIRVIFEAHGANIALAEPQYAVRDVDEVFLHRLKRLLGLVGEFELTEVRQADAVEWGPQPSADGSDDEFGIAQWRDGPAELVVTRGGFWFAAPVQYEDGHFETRCVTGSELVDQFLQAADGALVCLGEPHLQEAYEEALAHRAGGGQRDREA